MSDIAIRTVNLEKQYRIGVKTERYGTLRDSITAIITNPLQHFRRRTGQTFDALRGVSFELKRGEVLGVIGRNGAGKTTLLKILSRITEPSGGTAEIWGRVGSLLEVGTGFHLELTGRENIYLNGAILGMKRAEIERKLDEIVAFAEVDTFLDTPVKRYSTGMYLRLAFAVAAHLEPEILMVDEVLAVGDVAFQKKCLGKMGDVAKQDRTILFVSHNMAAIAQLCRTVLWLDKGQVRRMGSPAAVIGEYLSADTTAESKWRNSGVPNDKPAMTEAARILSRWGEPASAVGFDEGFQIEIDYCIRQSLRDLSSFCRVTDSRGHIIFDSYDTDTTSWRSRSLGHYRSVCTIPPRLLRPGRYFLTVGTWLQEITVFDEWQQVITFDVSAVGYIFDMDRWGIITPELNWTIVEREPPICLTTECAKAEAL